MKVYLLNPPSFEGQVYMKELGRCGRKSVAGEIWPQTGLAYLAAVSRESGHDVLLRDAMAEEMPVSSLLKEIRDWNPDFLIMHTTTPTFTNDSRIAHLIKEGSPEIRLGLTGTHPTAMPEQSLKDAGADFVLVGEAEFILSNVLDTPESDWDSVKGLCYWKDGQITVTERDKLIRDLNDLPFPARDLLPNERYSMPFLTGGPFATIIPGRGCPYPCTFCRAGTVWGIQTRLRKPELICDEIEKLQAELNINNVAFMTDTFTLVKKWTMNLCDEILKRNIKLTWVCNSRADTIDLEMLKAMKAAGCKLISFGLESGDQALLDGCKKGITLEQSRNAIRMTKEVGIISFAYFILGLVGETHETIQKTIDFAIELDPDYANFHIATPFPGTEFYNQVVANGWLTSEDWDDYEEEGGGAFRTENLGPEDLKRAQKQAMRRFYLRPGRILKEIRSIDSFPELGRKVKAGLNVFSKK